jgi:lipopolysaccharide export system permease protein
LKILDRYIAKYFLLNFVILFAACAGLIIMMEMVGNVDELIQAVRGNGGGWQQIFAAVVDFYGPKIFLFYHYLVGLMPIGAAGFTLVAMVRNREMVALLASGVSLYRIAAPVFVLGFLFSGVGMAVNQQVVMPKMAHLLGRKVRDIRTGQIRVFELNFVPDSRGRLFVSSGYDVENRTLENLSIIVRKKTEDLDQADPTDDRYGHATYRIEATQAAWSDHRNGWVLTDGRRYALEGVVSDTLAPEKAPFEVVEFLQTDLTPRVILLNQRARFRTFLSVGELGDLIENPPKVVDVRDLQRIRHGRFSQIVINLLVLAIGIPFFLVRAPCNMFLPVVKALGLCLLAWGGAIVMTQAAAPAGLAPALAAWLPVIVYLPLAYYLVDSVES